MPIYAGESLQITMLATDFDGDAIDNGSAVTVTVSVFDIAGGSVIDEELMTFSPDESLWVYEWDTSTKPPGNYTSKVTITGLGGTISWEYKTIRLAKNRTGSDTVIDNSQGVIDGGTP